MCRAILCAVFVLSTGSLYAQGPAPETQRIEELKLSQRCAEAGKKFLAQLDNGPFIYRQSQTQTHYNSVLGRCLLLQDGASDIVFRSTIYNAVDGNKVADYAWSTSIGKRKVSVCYTTDQHGGRVECV